MNEIFFQDERNILISIIFIQFNIGYKRLNNLDNITSSENPPQLSQASRYSIMRYYKN